MKLDDASKTICEWQPVSKPVSWTQGPLAGHFTLALEQAWLSAVLHHGLAE